LENREHITGQGLGISSWENIDNPQLQITLNRKMENRVVSGFAKASIGELSGRRPPRIAWLMCVALVFVVSALRR
jgi:hypothetical protein